MKKFEQLGRSLSKNEMKQILGGEYGGGNGCLKECRVSDNHGCTSTETCHALPCGDSDETRICVKNPD